MVKKKKSPDQKKGLNAGQRQVIRKHLSSGMLGYMGYLNFDPDNRDK